MARVAKPCSRITMVSFHLTVSNRASISVKLGCKKKSRHTCFGQRNPSPVVRQALTANVSLPAASRGPMACLIPVMNQIDARDDVHNLAVLHREHTGIAREQ